MKKQINFFKMHSIGNDYVYIDEFLRTDNMTLNKENLAKKISAYHYGVGSDGLIFLKKGNLTNYCMEMYNSDGTYSEMCANGLRALARYIYDYKDLGKRDIKIESGKRIYDLYVDDLNQVSLKMDISTLDFSSIYLRRFEFSNGKNLKYVCLNLSNPHCVVFLDNTIDLESMKIDFYVKELEKEFLKSLNYEFIKIKHSKFFYQRTWERGTGETLACGSGAIAAFISAYHLKFLESTCICSLKGGILECSFNLPNTIFQKGSTEYVFDGVYALE